MVLIVFFVLTGNILVNLWITINLHLPHYFQCFGLDLRNTPKIRSPGPIIEAFYCESPLSVMYMVLQSRALEPDCLGWIPALSLMDHVTSGNVLNLSEPQFHHQLHEDSSTYLIELLQGHSEPCMALG